MSGFSHDRVLVSRVLVSSIPLFLQYPLYLNRFLRPCFLIYVISQFIGIIDINIIKNVVMTLEETERYLPAIADESGLLTRKKLIEFLRRLFPNDSETRLGWRINALKRIGIISPVKRGLYKVEKEDLSELNIEGFDGKILRLSDIKNTAMLRAVSATVEPLEEMGWLNRIGKGIYSTETKQDFVPHTSGELRKLGKLLREAFPFLEVCITDSFWINSFISLQHFSRRFIIESEKGSEESVFDLLSQTYDRVLLKPSRKEIELYGAGHSGLIVVKKLVSQSPIMSTDDIPVSTLEKLLVDTFSDQQVFDYLQGSVLAEFFTDAFTRFTIDQSTLRRYAARRNKWESIKEFVLDKVGEVWVV